jgi:hypothetical protein
VSINILASHLHKLTILKPVALAAMNGSSKDIAKLHTVAQSLTDDEAIGLLLRNLDLSWIRSLDVLDIIADLSSRSPLSCIVNATKTFSSLFYIAHIPLLIFCVWFHANSPRARRFMSFFFYNKPQSPHRPATERISGPAKSTWRFYLIRRDQETQFVHHILLSFSINFRRSE